MDSPPTLRVLAWEMTRACPLKCRHCRAEALCEPPAGELTTAESKVFLDDLATMSKCLLILTGGEPMLRPDFFELAAYATELGLKVVAAPCGMYLTAAAARKLKETGVRMISLSVDGATAATHDGLRGVDGAFDMVLAAAAAAREADLPFQINTTVHSGNLEELESLSELVRREGAAKWDLFLLVPTGRGKEMAGQELTPKQYEETLIWARERALRGQAIKLTCAPHYVRVAAEKGLRGTPCLGGKSFAFVGHQGEVQICGFLDVSAGNIREKPFAAIWRESKLFHELRDWKQYTGKCGRCEYLQRCGGCRARAYALTGNYLGPEPYCVYQPAKAKATP